MRWVGFVRNVMIGREGLHRVTLLRLLAEAGGRDGRSHLATGNVTFIAGDDDARDVVAALEAGIERVIGRREPVITRGHEWLRRLVASRPFDGYDASTWELVMVLVPAGSAAIDAARIDGLEPSVVVEVTAHELLVARPRRTSGSHPGPLVEAITGSKATTRSWSTLELVARAGGG